MRADKYLSKKYVPPMRVKETDDLELVKCHLGCAMDKKPSRNCPQCHGTGDIVMVRVVFYVLPARGEPPKRKASWRDEEREEEVICRNQGLRKR